MLYIFCVAATHCYKLNYKKLCNFFSNNQRMTKNMTQVLKPALVEFHIKKCCVPFWPHDYNYVNVMSRKAMREV